MIGRKDGFGWWCLYILDGTCTIFNLPVELDMVAFCVVGSGTDPVPSIGVDVILTPDFGSRTWPGGGILTAFFRVQTVCYV